MNRPLHNEGARKVRPCFVNPRHALRRCLVLVLGLAAVSSPTSAGADAPQRVTLAPAGGFVLEPSGESFIPWGFNYDRIDDGTLLEDFWHEDWERIERDFAAMKRMGANVVRIHLQLNRFMRTPDEPDEESLDQFDRLLDLAEREGLYLNITGLNCYHPRDTPGWYDAMDEANRWAVQARFWEAVAERAGQSHATFCYNLMNEPVVPGAERAPGDWLGPGFGDTGKHYVQFITLDPAGRERPEIARQWIEMLTDAIRRHDRRTLITVGLVDWSLDRPGLTSGFVPERIADSLDFLAVHLYPEAGEVDAAIDTLAGFDVGKPLIISETFPLRASQDEQVAFMRRSTQHADGWLSFYWGKTPRQYRDRGDVSGAIIANWLDRFERLREELVEAAE